ncbi:FixH family protein [Bacillus sp. 1P06AnD]|uniref:FixH family protein n=1 Tax=Bacillus sp. 1P06AnD TaxID=3132208 RepID=UPI0039A0260C
MKKVWIALLSCVFILALGACGKEDKPSGVKDGELLDLDVELSVNPEQAQVNENITFTAKVKYGGKTLKKADEVKFEIWRSKSDHHDKKEIQPNEDGTYSLTRSFTEEGTYYIYSHVQAKGIHNMPKKEFTVGKPSEPETKEDAAKNMDMNMNMENSDHSK